MTLYSSPYPTPRDWRDADGPLGGGDTTTPVMAADLEDMENRAQRGEVFISDADVTGSVSALSRIEAAASALGTDGGIINLPPTRFGASEGIKFDGLLELSQAISIRGPGMRNCKISLTTAGAGIVLYDVDEGSRGGWSGGFTLLANNVALGKDSRGVFQTGGVNTGLKDARIESNPGIGWCFDGAQNVTCLGLDVANDGTKHNDSLGYYFDKGASGINLFSTKSSYMQAGYAVFDQSAAGTTREPSNICFYGNMLERNKLTTPAIYVKAGMGIWFVGGNISHGSVSPTPTEEYSIVKIANDAYWAANAGNGGDAITKNIGFRDLEINGTKGVTWDPYGDGNTDRYATIWELDSSLDIGANTQRDILTVGRGINPINILNGFDVGGTNIAVRHEGIEFGQGYGGMINMDRPDAVGRANAITIASASTLPIRSGVDFYFVTGTTTINNITETYVRHRITCSFASALTITESGNIRVKGASSVSVAAGETYDFVYDGTYWWVVG